VKGDNCIVRSSTVCEGQVLQVGEQESEIKREKKEDLLAKSADKNCLLYLNKS
jgi:hypothetical protein